MLRKVALSLCLTGSVVLSGIVGPLPHILAQDSKPKRPHMDLAFCIDTTGSMQSEIDMVKAKTKDLVAKLSGGHPAPVIRVGLVAYRDRGDDYVTKVFPFSEDIDKVVKDIGALQANGGGDGPEAVNQGLHAALNDLKWDADNKTAKLLFLIGDAPPHLYADDYKWEDESKHAIAHGIQINTIGCQGLEVYPAQDGVDVFKRIAKLADGKFDTLAYRQEVVNADGRKETLVTSGGGTYKLKAGGKADWKAEVAKGAVEKVTAATSLASPAPFARGKSLGAAYMAAESSMAGAGGSRQDSNLDELMLEAAKNKAAKSLKVDYGR